MASSKEERAMVYEEALGGLWRAGKGLLMGYAKDRSQPMPPMPDWDDLPTEVKAMFALETLDLGTDLMTVVETMAMLNAQRT